MEDYEIYNAKDMIDNAVSIKSRKKKFHLIKDKLEALVWDGVPRVAKTLHHFLGCEENELTHEALKLFML